MAIRKQIFKAPSCDGRHELSGVVFIPEGKPKGFYQIVHGMTEHIARYEKFMSDMTENGFLCFGYDNLGHGNTVNDDSELGYIAPNEGWDLLARDVKAFSDAVFAAYKKEDDIPYYLMGHSMGSFIARYAASKYVKPCKLIVMGTGGANPAASLGLGVIAVIKSIYGEKHFSPLVDKLAFGSYNKRFGGGTKDDPKPWLTNDESIRKKYYADKFCSFNFTVSAMGDLISIMKYANADEWYSSLPKDMPILLVSGENDPVGNYGKGITEVKAKLEKQNIPVSMVLYPEARHEILNDFCYEAVIKDILDFINKKL